MQGKSKGSVGAIRNDGNIIINAKDKAESFNHFFSKVGERLGDDNFSDNCHNKFQHIYQVTPTTEPLQLNSQKIKRAIDKRVKWCNRNCLTIHPDKTEVMLLTRNDFVGPLRPIKIGYYTINFVSNSRCLGFMIDNKLSWGHHTKEGEATAKV